MSAAKWELHNLIAVVDKNGNQINGPTSVIMPSLDPIGPKYEAMHWKARDIDGNKMAEVVDALNWAIETKGPTVLVSRSQTGFPISFMMGDYHWHHGVLSEELFLQAMADLREPVAARKDETWLPGYQSKDQKELK